MWHPSQEVTRRSDDSVVLRMHVAVDPALRSWILGFGHHARVVKPAALATDILEELEGAREQYVPPIPFEAEHRRPTEPGWHFCRSAFRLAAAPPATDRNYLAIFPFSSINA